MTDETAVISYTREPFEDMVSSIVGCHIEFRPGENRTMFDFGEDGRAAIKLHDYAVIPLEKTWLRGSPSLWKRLRDAFRGRIEP